MLSLKTDFQIPQDVIYLNASYMGPSPKSVTEVGKIYLSAKEKPWESSSKAFFDDTERLRSLFAHLLGSSAENIALVPSVSYGEETAALNIRLTSQQNIILLEGDFPSNVYPWRELSRRVGCEIVTVKRPNDHNWTNAILEEMNEQTALLAVPQCDWSDGTRIDLVRLSAACKAVGAALAVDLSQSFGAVPFPLEQVDPDYVFCVGYKWLLGPYGVSYMYVADRHLHGRPLENNWVNRKGSSDFSRLTEYQDDYLPGARRFDSGQHSQFILNPVACEALEYISKTGMRNIYEHCRLMNRRLVAGLTELGFTMAPEAQRVGHLLGAKPPTGTDARLLREALQKDSAFVSVRNNALRISPHLYNTNSDIEQFLAKTSYLIREKSLSLEAAP